jgi:hypothetical protein
MKKEYNNIRPCTSSHFTFLFIQKQQRVSAFEREERKRTRE